MEKMLFVTGTDTGVGKTVLTCLLLEYLRRSGMRAMAMKPFCAGGREDAEEYCRLMDGEVTLDQVNPFHFPEAAAPIIGMRRRRRQVPLETVTTRIQTLSAKCAFLLVEGCGGVFVPLSERYMVADLIRALGCPVLVVGPNKLGVINHTLLTCEALRARGVQRMKVVLMGSEGSGIAERTNRSILSQMLAPLEVLSVPFVKIFLSGFRSNHIKKKDFKKVLAQILKMDTFSVASRKPSCP